KEAFLNLVAASGAAFPAGIDVLGRRFHIATYAILEGLKGLCLLPQFPIGFRHAELDFSIGGEDVGRVITVKPSANAVMFGTLPCRCSLPTVVVGCGTNGP